MGCKSGDLDSTSSSATNSLCGPGLALSLLWTSASSFIKMRILNWISCSQSRWLDSMLSVGMLLTSTRLHSLHRPSLSSGPAYKNLGLFSKGCHGISNTTSRCAGRDGKEESLPLLYRAISMVLSGPDCQ